MRTDGMHIQHAASMDPVRMSSVLSRVRLLMYAN